MTYDFPLYCCPWIVNPSFSHPPLLRLDCKSKLQSVEHHRCAHLGSRVPWADSARMSPFVLIKKLSDRHSMPRFLGTAHFVCWLSAYFICTPLPGAMGMGKVHRSPQGCGYFLVSSKLLSVIHRQAAALHPLKQTDQGSLNGGRNLVFDL